MAEAPKKKIVIDTIAVNRHEGEAVLVPEKLGLERVIEILRRKLEAEEEVTQFQLTVPVFPWDGAIALAWAIEQVFGFVIQKATPTFFGPQPPQRISVATGPDTVTEVLWGQFSLPGVDGIVSTSSGRDADGRIQFVMVARVKGKHEAAVRKLFEKARDYAMTHSIYKGKAFSIQFLDAEGDLHAIPQIKFISGLGAMDPIFRRDVEMDIARNVFTPIRFTEALRRAGETIKRGILLAGRYGVGKTLLAGQMAREATANGWTFVYVQNVMELPHALRFAMQYQPTLVLAEDIDRAAGLERTDEVNEVLNTLDGVDSKTNDVMVVLTTNHPDRINPAMLRPGRIDAKVYIEPPDAEAAERIIRLYGGDLISKDEDLTKASMVLAGEIAATVGEIVKRAKLEAIRRAGTADRLTGEDICILAESYKRERDKFTPKEETEVHPVAQGADVIGKRIGEAMSRAFIIRRDGAVTPVNRDHAES